MLCTMQGDVWRVEGLDETLENVRWRRYASGLHQALGLVVAEGKVYVLGRDQITRLHDLDGDGEADFYECFSNAYATSTARPRLHQRPPARRRRAASTPPRASRGCCGSRPTADSVEVVATGFRNPDGLGLAPDGTITVPSSEGEWTPASMICEVQPGGHYGYCGPQNGQPPDLPLVYLPRGLDNSSGAQVTVARRPVRAARRASCSTSPSARARISCCSARRSTASRKARSSRCPASSSRACTGAGSTPGTASSTSRG